MQQIKCLEINHSMKYFKLRNAFLLVLVFFMLMSCASIKQPLPGSLWGDWTFVKTGTIINGMSQHLDNYKNVCSRESDRLRFSSDHKMNLRWYDESCTINEYLIGRYHVEHNTLKISLAESRPYQDSPFPLITEYRIIQISPTTLQLEELPDADWRNQDNTKSGYEALVFVFTRLE